MCLFFVGINPYVPPGGVVDCDNATAKGKSRLGESEPLVLIGEAQI
jgi:hypothetical protein